MRTPRVASSVVIPVARRTLWSSRLRLPKPPDAAHASTYNCFQRRPVPFFLSSFPRTFTIFLTQSPPWPGLVPHYWLHDACTCAPGSGVEVSGDYGGQRTAAVVMRGAGLLLPRAYGKHHQGYSSSARLSSSQAHVARSRHRLVTPSPIGRCAASLMRRDCHMVRAVRRADVSVRPGVWNV